MKGAHILSSPRAPKKVNPDLAVGCSLDVGMYVEGVNCVVGVVLVFGSWN